MSRHKRTWGEGSIDYREKADNWRWRGYYNCNGENRRKEIVASTQKELKAKVARWLERIEEGGATKRIKLKDWCSFWIDEVITGSVKPSTVTNYSITIRNHLVPQWGEKYLENITTPEIQGYINKLSKDHTPRTVQTILTHSKTCFDTAVDFGYLNKNPAKKVKGPRITRTKKQMLTLGEVKKILTVAKSGSYQAQDEADEAQTYLLKCHYLIILLAGTTGMRQGEILGLKWADLNLSKRKLEVKNNLAVVRGEGLRIDTPKTETSQRIIDLPVSTAHELEEWQIFQDHFEKKYGGTGFTNGDKLVFTNSAGKPISSVNFMHRIWHPILKAAGIKENYVFHDLRHFHASYLLSKGVNIKIISERLGHSSTSVTLDVYSHCIDETLQTKAAEEFDGIFDN